MISDEQMLAILTLYETGWAPSAIDEVLGLAVGASAQVIADDAVEYPDEPLLRVLH